MSILEINRDTNKDMVNFNITQQEYEILQRVLKAKKKEVTKHDDIPKFKAQSEKTIFVSYRVTEQNYKELEQVARSFFEVGAINRATVSALARYCLYTHQSMSGLLSSVSSSKTAPSSTQLALDLKGK